jgi:hypothetical protein
MQADLHQKVGKQLTEVNLTVAEPAIYEHTWVNWCESSHCPGMACHHEAKFAATVWVALIVIKKSKQVK